MEESIPRATSVLPAGTWPDSDARDFIIVGFDDRFRRRKLYSAQGGLTFLLDLAEPQVLRDGDGLVLATGDVVRVRAADEPLIAVTAATPRLLLRLAWHLGNRHLPAEIAADHILIREDHVISEMLEGLGATVTRVSAPFNPEGGAYGEHAHAPDQHHHHHDGHDHDHHH
jgi:urease accessory protein